VTEHEKYALGATKPGGFAEKGFADSGAAAGGPAAGGPAKGTAGEAVGLEFLATRPPWICRWAPPSGGPAGPGALAGALQLPAAPIRLLPASAD
jgi:hypothetical protein